MSLRTDFSMSREAARRISSAIGEVDARISTPMRINIGNIPDFFQGMAADALTDELTRWNANTNSIASEMQNLANEIRRVSDRIESDNRAQLETQQRAEAAARQAAAAAQQIVQQQAQAAQAAQQQAQLQAQQAAAQQAAAEAAARQAIQKKNEMLRRIISGGR